MARRGKVNPSRKGEDNNEGIEEVGAGVEAEEREHQEQRASRRATPRRKGNQSPSPDPRPRAPRPRKAPGFYAESLDSTEQAQLGEALEMEGLDEEIALLRVRLRRALEEQPEDTEFLLKSIALLARLMATRYRLSKTAEDDLYQSMLGVIKGIGGAIWPEGDGGTTDER